MNVHLSNVKQIEVHTAQPLLSGPSRLEDEIAIPKLKKHKPPGSTRIPAELMQAGGEILPLALHKHINFILNKEQFPDQWKKSAILPVHRKVDKTDCNNYRGILLLSTSYNILWNIFLRT
jgi:hypothetical protein